MDSVAPISIHMPKPRQLTILAAALLIFVAAFLLWQQQALDDHLVILHNQIYTNTALRSVFEAFSRYGMGFISLSYAALVLLSFRNEALASNRPLFLFIIFTFAIGSISGDLMKEVFARTRPVVHLANQIANTTLSGSLAFPSGHATKSMSLALPFLLMASGSIGTNRLFKVTQITAAILVSYSRLALQRHYPSDILAGAAFGLLAVVIGVYIVNAMYRRQGMDAEKLQRLSFPLALIFIVLAVFLCVI
ncbi:MAG: phosphatase PAP2 family protein [Anaerolineales bacterium]|nr:phosphatase PAP2 family protein [Anaerolineales bacterium]